MINFTFVGNNIIPEHYENVGYIMFHKYETDEGFETDTDFEFYLDDETLTDLIMIKLENDSATCNCCNHRIKRGVFFQNKLTKHLIFTGFDCATSIMKYSFDVVGAKKQNLQQRRNQERINNITKILDSNKNLEDWLKVNNKIIRNIAKNFHQYGKLSDKQIELVGKLATQRKEFELKSKVVVEGKVTDNFTIISIKEKINEYSTIKLSNGSYSSRFDIKMTLQHSDGWKVYGNLKSNISRIGNLYNISNFPFISTDVKEININDLNTLLVGKTINATMNIQKSNNDEYFGIFKRITKINIQ